MKMLVAYDGTLNSKEALSFGLSKARETGARLAVLSVFDPGPFAWYGAGPGALDVARKQWRAGLDDARAIIRKEGKGIDTSVFSSEGDPEEITLEFAAGEGVDLLLCTERQRSIIKRYTEMTARAEAQEVISAGEKARMRLLGVRAV